MPLCAIAKQSLYQLTVKLDHRGRVVGEDLAGLLGSGRPLRRSVDRRSVRSFMPACRLVTVPGSSRLVPSMLKMILAGMPI